MADFKTHITGSMLVGAGYGAAGFYYGASAQSSMLAAGLCGVAGILPDLDSDSGVPYRESVAFISAFIPVALVQRFEHLGWPRDTIVLACALIYIGMRFVVADFFRRYTVHRGMWHSIPAAVSVGLIAFLVSDDQDLLLRGYWTGAAVLGFLVHLVLDEIYSVDFRGVRLKKSFGTALKFWSNRGWWPNVSTYGKLTLLILLAWGDPKLSSYLKKRDVPIPQTARKLHQTIDGHMPDVQNDAELIRR